MAAHTKIIDLFGIPACGKSTLADYLSNGCQTNLRIGTMQNVAKEVKHNLMAYICSISFNNLIAILKLRFAAPFDKKRRAISLSKWFLHDVLYNYIKKHSDYDLVLVDHGIIQSLVTLERGDNLHEKSSFAQASSRYIDIIPVTLYVYCQIEEEVALARMQNRHRNKGRIDMLNDATIQLSELEMERNRFDFYAEMLNRKQKAFIELNMLNETVKIAEYLLLKINKNNY